MPSLPVCCAWGLRETQEKALKTQNGVLAAATGRSHPYIHPTLQNVTSSPSARFKAALTWILSSNKDVGIW